MSIITRRIYCIDSQISVVVADVNQCYHLIFQGPASLEDGPGEIKLSVALTRDNSSISRMSKPKEEDILCHLTIDRVDLMDVLKLIPADCLR